MIRTVWLALVFLIAVGALAALKAGIATPAKQQAELSDNVIGRAAEALSKADCLSTGIYRLHARWYLAQSYILNRQTPKAVPLLQWVVSQKFGDHGEQAASLLANVSKGK